VKSVHSNRCRSIGKKANGCALKRRTTARRRLAQLLRHVRLWPLDAHTFRLNGAVYLELRRLGRALSQVDMVLGGLAGQHRLTVLTTDQDYEALADLRVENWAV
jgi:predicted nucleic acid-binding protein